MLQQELVLRCQFAEVRGTLGPKCQEHGLEQPEREASLCARDVSHRGVGRYCRAETVKRATSEEYAELKDTARVRVSWKRQREDPQRPMLQLQTRQEGCQSQAGPLRYPTC